MKKTVSVLLILLLLTGCAAPQTQTGPTITDALGRQVTIDGQPQRVASLLGSFSDVWLLAGGSLVASAEDAWADFGLELPDALDLGKTKSPSLETLLQAQPELVLASANTQADVAMLPTLEAAGIPTLYFSVSTFEDYLQMLDICTDLTGQKERYQQYGLAQQEEIAASIDRVQTHFGENPPTVLYLRASAASIRAKNSHGSVLGEMLADFGCINLADSQESLLENLSIEHILQADPDYIFFVQLGDDTAGTQAHIDSFFADNPALSSLSAVQEGRVILLDKRLYNLKPNALWAQAYLQLEAILCGQTP